MGCLQSGQQVDKAPKAPQGNVTEAGAYKIKGMGGVYTMLMTKEDVMGEGTSSICRRGRDDKNQLVAIKMYKEQKKGGKVNPVVRQKFKRQVDVLKELQEPLKKHKTPALWHDYLNTLPPSKAFMQLLAHSPEATGDPYDGCFYVVTELAQYSLKDYITSKREKQEKIAMEAVQRISHSIVAAMACLHAKNFVHIDMKPENLMMFNGQLKVIDVDGCVKAESQVSIQDSSISFSPCYCAPEWAKFLIDENCSQILASPALDAWSVGMTLCELVTLDAILKPQYANFLRNAHSHREAGFLFMEWLSCIKKAPLPKSISNSNKDLLDLLHGNLLVCRASSRASCAQCLDHPFIKAGQPGQKEDSAPPPLPVSSMPAHRARQADTNEGKALKTGVLFKLNSNGDKTKDDDWIQRDMFLKDNHSLVYFSQKENKRLVLIDGLQLDRAIIKPVSGATKEFAFMVKLFNTEDTTVKEILLAAQSKDQMEDWIKKLERLQTIVKTFKLDKEYLEQLEQFRLTVNNRRLKIGKEDEQNFEPKFKGELWKLKAEGNAMKDEDWFKRDMWVSKNGSLVYSSVKEERDLVYYTCQDIQDATISKVSDGTACKDFVFTVQLKSVDSIEYHQPGMFAAASNDMRERWMSELKPELKP